MPAPPHLVDYPGRRLIIALPQPYDEARSLYERLVPRPDYPRFGQLATWDAVLELAEINAPLGFMRYYTADITATMAGSPSGWKATQYLMGNHTIAERMFRHDPAVMLYAPLRTMLFADPGGDTQFAVEQPSLLFDSFAQPAISTVGRELDVLLAGLLAKLGASLPPTLNSVPWATRPRCEAPAAPGRRIPRGRMRPIGPGCTVQNLIHCSDASTPASAFPCPSSTSAQHRPQMRPR
jgi:hypothetical protein